MLMAAPLPHVPVLLDRVVELLGDAPDGVIVDLTLGAAGHAHAVLERRLAVHGRAHLLGIDRDPDALELARARLGDLDGDVEVELVHARFDELDEVLDERGIDTVAGRADGPRHLLDARGPARARLQLPARGSARHADGPDPGD
jgi:16S rRNA (cytosine1402-N4)-methyltransferase